MTIAHTGIVVPKAKVAEVVAWYLKALAPLGYKQIVDYNGVAVGLGDNEHEADFWVVGKEISENVTAHLAFAAPDQETVQAFYKAAIDAGGKDNGPPGLRTQYTAGYYAAFVIDPVGNNIEAVHNAPPQ